VRTLLSIIVMACVLAQGVARAQAPTIEEFAASSSFGGAAISPSGRYVAGIVHSPSGDRLVVMDWAAGSSTPIGQTVRGQNDMDVYLNWVAWKSEDRLIYSVTATGTRYDLRPERRRSVSRVQSVNRSGGDVRELMGEDYSLASVVLNNTLPADPEHVLLLAGDTAGVALWRVHVLTAEAERVESSSRYLGGWWVNREGEAVLRLEFPRDGGGYRIARSAPGSNRWIDVTEVLARSFEENRDFSPFAAGPSPELYYVSARPEGSNYTAVYLFNTATGEFGEPIAQSETGDITRLRIFPPTDELLAYCTYDAMQACRATNAQFEQEWEAITFQLRNYGDVSLADVSEDGQTWLIYADGPTNPGLYAVYSRAQQSLSVLTRVRPTLTAERLNPTEVIRYRTRDGVDLFGYLTRPRNARGALPTVVMPHGGPESRDYQEYDFLIQFLASRGYAVFQPQFRGSEGFGRAFAAQGHGQWGGRMQDDVTDAARHLINAGIAPADRICIAGISYGAYSAMIGATMTPDLYRCAIGIAGVYDLPVLVRDERRLYGSSSLSVAYTRRTLGTVTDREALARISPNRHVTDVRSPILLIHGEEDWVADPEHSQLMRDALTGAGKDVRYVEIADVRHPFSGWRESQRAQLLTEVETFLATHLQAPN
jgi:dipeptidyl aminopeptidase/acylaminoacyl peptidase